MSEQTLGTMWCLRKSINVSAQPLVIITNRLVMAAYTPEKSIVSYFWKSYMYIPTMAQAYKMRKIKTKKVAIVGTTEMIFFSMSLRVWLSSKILKILNTLNKRSSKMSCGCSTKWRNKAMKPIMTSKPSKISHIHSSMRALSSSKSDFFSLER